MIPLFIQIAAGFLIGFFLADKKRGLTNVQFKLSVIVIMLTASAFIFTGGSASVYAITMLAFYSLVMVGSIFAGEYFHGHIIQMVLDSIHKEEIHRTVKRFVKQVKRLGHGEDINKNVLDVELYRTVNSLHELSKQAKKFKHDDLAKQVDELAHTCVNLLKVGQEMDESKCRQRYEKLADSLLKISWDTLENAEVLIKRDLSKSWNTFTFALRTLI